MLGRSHEALTVASSDMPSIGRRLSRCRISSLVKRAPLIGEVKNHILVEGADFDDPEFGASRAMPSVLEIRVGGDRGSPGCVGAIVKERFFRDEGRFIFNVAFSCGDPGLLGPGVYGDPRSIWFNVFFGYYQIDVPRSLWSRPFGYESAEPGAPLAIRDILRIGKADWNWFSNYMYGVPREAIEKHDAIGEVPAVVRPRRRIGGSWWDDLELDGVEVVSAYVAPGEKDRLCNHDPVLSPIWRAIFGRPCPRPDRRESFIPTTMHARMYLSFRAVDYDDDLEESAYSTLIFGGTVAREYPDAGARQRFLARQIGAVEHVMTHRYADAGFPDAGVGGARAPAARAASSGQP